jgi:adenosylhomocysteine nucleosidase
MDRGEIGFVVGLRAEARLLRGLNVKVAIGGGMPAGAAEAAAQLAGQGGLRGLISFGLAGGLDPALQPGALLVPAEILENGVSHACDPALAAWLGGTTGGALLAGSEIAASASAKAALFAATGAAAVDLESGAVARVASSHRIAFAALRAVADPAGRDLPPAALIALNGAGRIGLLAILASVLRQPTQVPSLLALARDAATARRALLDRITKLKRT